MRSTPKAILPIAFLAVTFNLTSQASRTNVLPMDSSGLVKSIELNAELGNPGYIERHPVRRIVINSDDAGVFSLRDRIQAACPADTIAFEGALASDTIRLDGQEIILDKHTVISGLGIDLLSISGEQNSRVFHIMIGQSIHLYDLELREGTSATDGGAILNQGTLQLSNIRLRDNLQNGQPHGLTNYGILSIQNSVVIDHQNE